MNQTTLPVVTMLLPEMRQPNRLRRHRSHRPGPRKQPAGRSIEHVEATARVVGEPLGRLPLLSSGTVRTADWRTAAEAPATGCQRGTPPRAMHSRAGKVERLRQARPDGARGGSAGSRVRHTGTYVPGAFGLVQCSCSGLPIGTTIDEA